MTTTAVPNATATTTTTAGAFYAYNGKGKLICHLSNTHTTDTLSHI